MAMSSTYPVYNAEFDAYNLPSVLRGTLDNPPGLTSLGILVPFHDGLVHRWSKPFAYGTERLV